MSGGACEGVYGWELPGVLDPEWMEICLSEPQQGTPKCGGELTQSGTIPRLGSPGKQVPEAAVSANQGALSSVP